jgi:hypothetical protein
MKRLERLKNTVNIYMADIRPDRLTQGLYSVKWSENLRVVVVPVEVLTVNFPNNG